MPPVATYLGIIPLRSIFIRHALKTLSHSRQLHHSSFVNTSPAPETKSSSLVDGATEVSHSHFLTTSGAHSDFNPAQKPTAGLIHTSDPIGKLDPTNNSHLFKLILPLPLSLSRPTERTQTAFLLHPSQPLSHLSRLIVGSLKSGDRNADIQYLALTGREQDLEDHLRNAELDKNQDDEGVKGQSEGSEGGEGSEGREEGGPFLNERKKEEGRYQEVSWSQSTDLSDFIKQSCLNEKFKIVITPEVLNSPDESSERASGSQGKTKGAQGEKQVKQREEKDITIEVKIPSFASRTTYLRERLLRLTKELNKTTKKKKE